MEEKTRYSSEELAEFEELINKKLEGAKKELEALRRMITKGKDTNESHEPVKGLDDGAESAERENLNQLAARQAKFIKNLENALLRIKNGTYGICVDTGKLIRKERLRAVPHTMHSIEAKMKDK